MKLMNVVLCMFFIGGSELLLSSEKYDRIDPPRSRPDLDKYEKNIRFCGDDFYAAIRQGREEYKEGFVVTEEQRLLNGVISNLMQYAAGYPSKAHRFCVGNGCEQHFGLESDRARVARAIGYHFETMQAQGKKEFEGYKLKMTCNEEVEFRSSVEVPAGEVQAEREIGFRLPWGSDSDSD